MRPSTLRACVLGLLLLGGCTEPDLRPRLSVEMTGELFLREGDGNAVAPFVVRSIGAHPAHFLGCPAPITAVVERFGPRGWMEHLQANTVCSAVHTPVRLQLAPGDSYRTTFSWDLPGAYRIRVLFGTADNPYAYSALSEPFEFR